MINLRHNIIAIQCKMVHSIMYWPPNGRGKEFNIMSFYFWHLSWGHMNQKLWGSIDDLNCFNSFPRLWRTNDADKKRKKLYPMTIIVIYNLQSLNGNTLHIFSTSFLYLRLQKNQYKPYLCWEPIHPCNLQGSYFGSVFQHHGRNGLWEG